MTKQARCALHSPLMRSIHPQNFITIAIIVLAICTGQKSSLKVNKGQSLKKKKKANKSYGSCALHSPLLRSIHPQNFITIVSTVLEICSGRKFKYENKERAITQKLSNQELQFMCTALPLDEIYPPTKFHNHS